MDSKISDVSKTPHISASWYRGVQIFFTVSTKILCVSFPWLLDAHFISSSLIRSSKQYFVRITNHDVSHNLIFSSLLSLLPSRAQILSTSCFQKSSICSSFYARDQVLRQYKITWSVIIACISILMFSAIMRCRILVENLLWCDSQSIDLFCVMKIYFLRIYFYEKENTKLLNC